MKKREERELDRCPWCLSQDESYMLYHDREWGRPVYEDRKHFEFLVLESAQAGLSWFSIFKRRSGYQEAFADFDPEKVALFDSHKVEELMNFSGIIRNRKKIEAAIENAKIFLRIQKEWGSFNSYIWSFVESRSIQNKWTTLKEVPCTSPQSIALSLDMKKRGFKFVGPTILYSHMQATGLINDHLVSCFCHKECSRDS